MTPIERCRVEQKRAAQYLIDNPDGPEVRGAKQGLYDWMAEEIELSDEYARFLANKSATIQPSGFECDTLNPLLFPFQRDIVRWALRRGKAAIWADCGLGKSFMQLEWANRVHRHTGKPVLVFTPLAVAEQTAEEARKFAVPEVKVVSGIGECINGINISNYEKLHHFTPEMFGGIVLDECFPQNTLIDTPSGRHYIKDIREGDTIYNACGEDQVSNVHRREVKWAVKVAAGGKVCISSPNHPYFTQRGWVGAQDLRPGDSIVETAEAMRLLWGFGGPEANRGDEALLRSVLLSEMADAPTSVLSQGSQPGSGEEAGRVAQEMVCAGFSASTGRNRAHPPTESDDRSDGTGKSLPHIESHEAQTFRSWWQWSWPDGTSVDNVSRTGAGLDCGVSLVIGETNSRLSNMLQGRLSVSRQENRHRGGWQYAPFTQEPGRQERCEVGRIGVDCIEILEPGHPELEQFRDADGHVYFYDIGATRHPSFSVNGWLVHNSSILKALDGKTRKLLTEFAKDIPYRLACTATPSPNDHMELGMHAEWLGVMKHAEMLSMFFCHDGGETSKWRLKGHAETPFWKFVCSWAVAIRKPSDIGHDDEGFNLKRLVMHQITVESKEPQEGYLFAVEAASLQERQGARKASIDERVAKCAELVNGSNEQWLVWCNLNEESTKLRKAIPDAVEVTGSDHEHIKSDRLHGFAHEAHRVLVSKPLIAGFGMNFQCCHNVIFVGLSDSYEQFYQAIRRCWRFGQQHEVNCYVVTADTEGAVVRNIERKEMQAREMMDGMVEHMKTEMQKEVRGNIVARSEYERDVAKGDDWIAHLGDSCEILRDMPSEHIGYSIYSPPFASLYTYSNSDRDLGNCGNDAEFFKHYQFIVKELYRVLKPGRLVSFHCMQIPLSKERDGVIGLKDFRGDLIRIHQAAGFVFHSEVCIWKDPVTAMQRTKAIGLLHKQIVKDSCMSRQGIPDYLVTMRKPGQNLEPVAGEFDRYIGADGTGPRGAAGTRLSIEVWQRYASPVWMDIDPSDTLQRESAREEEDERHICPLQLQVIERGMELWSNPGDTVYSPFMGIGSEGYVALRCQRRFIGSELKRSYWEQAVRNLRAAEKFAVQNTLFEDLA